MKINQNKKLILITFNVKKKNILLQASILFCHFPDI